MAKAAAIRSTVVTATILCSEVCVDPANKRTLLDTYVYIYVYSFLFRLVSHTQGCVWLLLMRAGFGFDTLYGEAGSDALIGGKGTDKVVGGWSCEYIDYTMLAVKESNGDLLCIHLFVSFFFCFLSLSLLPCFTQVPVQMS